MAAAFFVGAGGFPLMRGNAGPDKAPQASQGSASSPHSGEPFCAGEARERSLPCQREVPSASEAEGFPAVCGSNGRPDKARRNPPGRWRGQPFGPGPLCRSATSPHTVGSHPLTRGPLAAGFNPLMGGIAKPRAGHARPLRTAVSGSGGSGELPNLQSEQRARALRTKSNTAFV